MNAELTTYTVKEAAARLRLSAASVYDLCKKKALRHRRVGPGRGKIVIPADALEDYLAGSEVGAAGGAAPPPPPVNPPARPKPLHVRMRP